jgi:tetratricopeptide (TPR) repeat protein
LTALARRFSPTLGKDALMGLDSLLALVCAGVVMAGGPDKPESITTNDAQNNAVASTLAVQTALQRGRECLREGNYKAAVAALESQIAYINGSTPYLQELQKAYKGYIKELRLASRDADAQIFLSRLTIIDRDASNEPGLMGRPGAARVARPGPISAADSKTNPTIRLQRDEESREASGTVGVRKSTTDVADLLTRADQEFNQNHFEQAKKLYEQASALDPKGASSCRERLAYCKLHHVVEELNKPAAKPRLVELEREARVALSLAPRLDFGKKVLAEIELRRNPASATSSRPETQVVVRQRERNSDGWLACETAGFIIYYKETPEFATQAAQAAESVRATMQQKWFGGACREWNPPCVIYLHPTAEDYSRATGQYNSPGHSSIRIENGHFIVRQIDLHCDDPNMLTAILPHEATHIVLASGLGEQQVERLPRWADEGVAVLTEPREKVDRHLANLAKARQDGQLFSCRELMELPNYPQNPRQISTFYAQSVSLVEFLSGLQGSQTFMLFLQDSMRYGYEKSLQRHFNIGSFSQLEERWTAHIAGDQSVASRVAGSR